MLPLVGLVGSAALRRRRVPHARREPPWGPVWTKGLGSTQYVVVRLHARKTARRKKWQVGKLVHTTPDEAQWVIQWCNTESGGSMLNARYYPAWLLPDGETEKFADNQQTGWQPIWHVVHKRRFITPAFALSGGKIPNAIRAVLRSKFANANL